MSATQFISARKLARLIFAPDGRVRLHLRSDADFWSENVTSVDWLTYPILDITEAPQSIDVVLVNRPEIAPSGSGEPSIRPIAAAIANAIFDATGVRIRRVPFSPDRVKGALS